jgi:hypothetical protein
MDDAGGDVGDDVGRWMTYADFASARGISKRTAVRLAQRHRLRRQPGNDGLALVFVPPEVAAPPVSPGMSRRGRQRRDDADVDAPGDVRRQSSGISALRSELTGLRETLDHTLALLADAQAGRDRADAALAGERSRADVLRDRLDAAERDQREAQEAAETLRQAELARQARGLLARLLDAWRG